MEIPIMKPARRERWRSRWFKPGSVMETISTGDGASVPRDTLEVIDNGDPEA
jgi:hypothetical protein